MFYKQPKQSKSHVFLSCFQTNWTMKRVLTTKRREMMMRTSSRERETKGKRYVTRESSPVQANITLCVFFTLRWPLIPTQKNMLRVLPM